MFSPASSIHSCAPEIQQPPPRMESPIHRLDAWPIEVAFKSSLGIIPIHKPPNVRWTRTKIYKISLGFRFRGVSRQQETSLHLAQGSVSLWIQSLNSGELDAAQKLWDRYASLLLELARAKLGAVTKGHADEEDIAQNVFASLCRGAAAGRLIDVKNRD